MPVLFVTHASQANAIGSNSPQDKLKTTEQSLTDARQKVRLLGGQGRSDRTLARNGSSALLTTSKPNSQQIGLGAPQRWPRRLNLPLLRMRRAGTGTQMMDLKGMTSAVRQGVQILAFQKDSPFNVYVMQATLALQEIYISFLHILLPVVYHFFFHWVYCFMFYLYSTVHKKYTCTHVIPNGGGTRNTSSSFCTSSSMSSDMQLTAW